MEEGDTVTPFWLQTSDNRRRRLRQPSSFFLNTVFLIILLLIIAFAFVVFIIPSFLSFTSKIFKPQLVKKSWDSVNLVLVLFAIICGFLGNSKSNNNDNDNNDNTPATNYEGYKFSSTPSPKHVDDHSRGSNASTPSSWYDDHYSSSSNRTAYNSLQRLKSSSSYPDLRQESSWMMNGDGDRWRFYDDTHLYNYRSRSRRQHDQEQVYNYINNNKKDIPVDTVRMSPPPPYPAPPATATGSFLLPPQSSPPQLPKVVRRKPKTKERSERKEVIFSEMKIKHSLPPAPPQPSQPPPPPPTPPTGRPEKRSSRGEKMTGTKEFLISLRRKKKKERQRSVENLDEFFKLSMLPLYPPPSPPPPPPPPPPPLPSFYQSIFSSKKTKARKHHSVLPSPPPSLEDRASKRESHTPPVMIQKPPFPVKIDNMNNVEESVESGNESPINPIPPPPPPPPFKLRPWKFEVQGDFVRLKSINSSRCESPDSDDPLSGEASPSDGNKMGEMEGDDSTAGALFCPSPDVNTKADNFIARFRAGLTLEKINSGRGRSNLGPDPGPSTL